MMITLILIKILLNLHTVPDEVLEHIRNHFHHSKNDHSEISAILYLIKEYFLAQGTKNISILFLVANHPLVFLVEEKSLSAFMSYHFYNYMTAVNDIK